MRGSGGLSGTGDHRQRRILREPGIGDRSATEVEHRSAAGDDAVGVAAVTAQPGPRIADRPRQSLSGRLVSLMAGILRQRPNDQVHRQLERPDSGAHRDDQRHPLVLFGDDVVGKTRLDRTFRRREWPESEDASAMLFTWSRLWHAVCIESTTILRSMNVLHADVHTLPVSSRAAIGIDPGLGQFACAFREL